MQSFGRLFSIVTPSYRQPDWLMRCAASIRDQVEPGGPFQVEHIIQDGGTENITELATRLRADLYLEGELVQQGDLGPSSQPNVNYRISIFQEKDSSMYDALNRGLARAKGDICAWLNSDEQYLPGTLRQVHEYFLKHPQCEVLLGDAILLDSKLQPVAYRRIMVPTLWHTRLCHLHSLSCAMFFRPEILPDPPFEARWKVIGDAVLMDNILIRRRKVDACRIPLSTYCFTGENLSREPSPEKDLYLRERGGPSRIWTSPVSLLHRLRRFLHGAYKLRDCDVALYLSQEGGRECRQGSLGGIWRDSTKG